jgi:hypothetical protein
MIRDLVYQGAGLENALPYFLGQLHMHTIYIAASDNPCDRKPEHLDNSNMHIIPFFLEIT